MSLDAWQLFEQTKIDFQINANELYPIVKLAA